MAFDTLDWLAGGPSPTGAWCRDDRPDRSGCCRRDRGRARGGHTDLSDTVSLGDSVSIGTGASGGTTPYTWTESGLPSFLTATSGGAWNQGFSILGTATAVGTYPFRVTLSDSAGTP